MTLAVTTDVMTTVAGGVCTVAVPLLDLSQQHMSLLPQMQNAFEQIVRSGQFVLGSHVRSFEQQLADRCQVGHAVGVSSGTDALLMALMALEVGPGDEVITSPFTFFATAAGITRLGAQPVFVDIDPVTLNIDPSLIEAAITSKTKAIIPVHLYGQAACMEPIMHTARARGIRVVEDAAQAIGALDRSLPVGSIGDVGCFSFYPTKNLSALGDAGACTTGDPQLAGRLQRLRVHGQGSTYHHLEIGGNFRIDALQAAMLSVKLPNLTSWNDARRTAAGRYHQLLADLPLRLPSEAAHKFHVYNQYTIRVNDGRRQALSQYLKDRGIGHEVYYPIPLHRQPCFAYLEAQQGDYPVAEKAASEVMSLPIYPGLTVSQQEEVATAIRQFFARGVMS